jgi:hypothetical protein
MRYTENVPVTERRLVFYENTRPRRQQAILSWGGEGGLRRWSLGGRMRLQHNPYPGYRPVM